MNFGAGIVVRRGDGGKQPAAAAVDEANQLNLCMYAQPERESGKITLEQFQTLGKKRLDVLKAVETLREKHGSDQDEYRDAFIKKIGAMMPLAINGCKNSELTDARRDDRVSHFILRLAFCQTPEQSDWLVRQEVELFRMRFQFETAKGVRKFISANAIKIETLESGDKEQMLSELCNALTLTPVELSKTDVYKVDFLDVLDLVASHRVYLRRGDAFISGNELSSLVIPRFRDCMTASLAHARTRIGYLQEEDRLIPLMKSMVHGGVAYRKEFQDPNAEHITADMVETLARTSFPPCMRQIHFTLRREHHLRHFARRQYGLFLKGIGLSVESALEFFRAEFTKKIDNEKFAKEYAYNIRHMYGKEGKRVDQKPLSCATIILGTAPAGPQDCHGCPFKHLDANRLARQLEGVGLNNGQIQELVNLSKANRFDKACTRYFECTHQVELEDMLITNPNQYYSLSRQKLRGGVSVSASQQSAKSNTEPEGEPMEQDL